MNPRICFALLFLSTLAFSEYAANAQQQQNVKIATPIPLNVGYPPHVAIPIQFASNGYVGPYDPADPRGLIAAQHRRAKLAQQNRAQVIKSYVPPGVGKYVKKEGMKTAVKESERFAFAHPVETADFIGIATRAKHLYHLGSSKITKADHKSDHKDHKGH